MEHELRITKEGVLVMMDTRLTIENIEKQYPNQWVGLTGVEWDPENDASILAANVRYTGLSQSELLSLQISSDDEIVPYFTTPDTVLQLGALM
jgi:hypothetical protein